MATALARGFAAAELFSADQIAAADPSPAARERFSAEIAGCRVFSANSDAAADCDVLVLAVKPPYAAAVLREIADAAAKKLVISIAAGVRTGDLAAAAPAARIIRAMPNTPALIGEGAAAVAAGRGATSDDLELARRMFSAVGVATVVDESLLDAVTALSGSGPAYAFVMIEALADGGVREGLPRDVALRLAAQTIRGAASLVLAGEHPGVLKDRVASPGGTTIAGLAALEQQGVRSACIEAVTAAAARSRELAEKSG